MAGPLRRALSTFEPVLSESGLYVVPKTLALSCVNAEALAAVAGRTAPSDRVIKDMVQTEE